MTLNFLALKDSLALKFMALKRWQRFASIAVVGGGLAYAGWAEFIRPVTAEPAPSSEATSNDRPACEGPWVRSAPVNSCPSCPAAVRGCSRPLDFQVAESGPVVPSADPAAPALLPQQITIPVGPRQYEAGLTGPNLTLPEVPAFPGSPASQQPMPLPVAPSEPVQKIGASIVYVVPNQPTSSPLPVPMPTMSTPVSLEVAPGSRVNNDGVANLAPTPPPLKFPDQAQPVMPIPADSRLPSSDGWLNVKMEYPSSGGVPNIPPAPAMLPVPPAGQPSLPIPAIAPQQLPSLPSVGVPDGPMGSVVDRPKAIENVLPYSEKDAFTFSVHHDSEFILGENNMLLSQNHAAVMAVVGGLFMSSTAPALADDKDNLAALKTQMEETNKKLKEIQDDIKKLNELLAGKKDETGATIPTKGGVVEQLRDLQNRLGTIEQNLEKIKNQSSTSLRPSNPPVTPNSVVEPKPARGIVRIVNEYPVPISMVINNVSHRIEPTRTLDVPVNAGDFTYQLVESGAAPKLSHIKENETVTLRIK